MEAQVFEKFVDVDVLLKDENRPPVRSRMLAHQTLHDLYVYIAKVVHSPVYFADVDAENGQLVAIEGVLQEAEVDLHFEFRLKDNPQKYYVFATLSLVVGRHPFSRGDNLVHRQVLEDAAESGYPA